MKKFLSAFLILSLLLTFAACGQPSEDSDVTEETETVIETETENETETETESETEMSNELKNTTYDLSLTENVEQLKLYGRMSRTGMGLTCDFAASGIEFNVYAEGFISIGIECVAQTVESHKNDNIYLAVIVDGVRDARRFKVNKGESTTLDIAYFETAGEHNIQILRETEAKNGLLNLKSINLTGRLTDAPKDADLYIEFIGDSITSGYGNLAQNGVSNAGSPDYKDALSAYSYLTAKALGADFSLVSISGVGLTSSYRPMRAKALFEAQTYYRVSTVAYTPKRTPDVVVVNLGTNDEVRGADKAAYRQDVAELIASIRAKYGDDIKIVWAYGMMNSNYISEVNSVISGMDNIYTIELPNNREGANGHPNAATHILAAERLSDFINSTVLGNS